MCRGCTTSHLNRTCVLKIHAYVYLRSWQLTCQHRSAPGVRPAIVRMSGTAGASDGRATPEMGRGGAGRRAGRGGGGRRRGHEWRLHGRGCGQSRHLEVRVRRGDDGNDVPTWARGRAQPQALPQWMGRPESGPVARGAHGTHHDHRLGTLPRPAGTVKLTGL